MFEDESRIAQYEKIQSDIETRALKEQAIYQNFERSFFKELEDFVIKKKTAARK